MQLGQLQAIESDILSLGYQMLAISADQPENLVPTVDKHSLGFTVLSDSKMDAARAFGLAFQIDDPTYERYKGFGIDLEKASGAQHRQLPVPAVFIFDASGKIAFSYVNPDYRVRVPPSVILAAAKAAAE